VSENSKNGRNSGKSGRDSRSQTGTNIRTAELADLAELVRIYNHYVENTAVTFDTMAYTPDARRTWLNSFRHEGPYRLLVAENDGHLLGYASSSRFKSRPAYNTSVETSIYLQPEVQGNGIGTALYSRLLDELCTDEALHRAYGGIALPNDASVALHEKLGFVLAGTYREVGYKFGEFWDVAWYEKNLSG